MTLVSAITPKTMHLPRHQRTAYVGTICCLTLTLCSPPVTAKLQSQHVNGPNLISHSNNRLVNEIQWWPQSKNNSLFASPYVYQVKILCQITILQFKLMVK